MLLAKFKIWENNGTEETGLCIPLNSICYPRDADIYNNWFIDESDVINHSEANPSGELDISVTQCALVGNYAFPDAQ